jgi:ABC-2 type transport system permease protein
MNALLTIACKDLRVLARDRMALFWALGFPVVFALFFGSIMKVGGDAERAPIPVVLVADDGSARVSETARAMRAAGLKVTALSAPDAQQALRRGAAALLVDLPAPGELGPVRLAVDATRRAEAEMATGVLQVVLLRAIAGPQVALPPFETIEIAGAQRGPRTGYQLVFPAMILWGLIGCAAAFAVGIVAERSSGALLRLYAGPFGRSAIVGGKALACALACLLGSLVLSALGVGLLGVEITDPLKYALALLSAAACFVGITQLLSVLGRSEQAVAGAGWSVLIVLAMSGGAMVPAVLMPNWLRALSAYSPVRWGVDALQGATFRAQGWAELAPPLLSLFSAGLGCFALAALVMRLREA